jgi:hypothetical protein
LYDVYPIWRIIIVDREKVLINFFLKGRRGTESDQVILSGAENHWTQAHIDYFDVIWNYHSKEVKIEDYFTH